MAGRKVGSSAKSTLLSRSLSPALIAEYQTQLPDKALLQAKLREFYLQTSISENGEGRD